MWNHCHSKEENKESYYCWYMHFESLVVAFEWIDNVHWTYITSGEWNPMSDCYVTRVLVYQWNNMNI